MRSHMQFLFESIVSKHPNLYQPWVEPPLDINNVPAVKWEDVAERYALCQTSSVSFKCIRLMRESVVFKDEPFQALHEIFAACTTQRDTSFLLSNQIEPVNLEAYEQRQKEQMT